MSKIIFATSGSGKSYFAKRAHGPSGLCIVDGDAIVSATVGWPKPKMWWKLPENQRWQENHARSVRQVMERNPDIIVVWWASLKYVWPILSQTSGMTAAAGVQISEVQLRANWLSREKAIKAGESGHHSRSWESYKSGWEKALLEFHECNFPVYDSFETLAQKWKLWVDAKANM